MKELAVLGQVKSWFKRSARVRMYSVGQNIGFYHLCNSTHYRQQKAPECDNIVVSLGEAPHSMKNKNIFYQYAADQNIDTTTCMLNSKLGLCPWCMSNFLEKN